MAVFKFPGKAQAPRQFPEGRLGFAVGDIHGRADLLARMFERLEQDAESNRYFTPPIVVFLGDYIDRGPDSAEVIELLLTGRPEGFERRFLRGNHEAALLGFLNEPLANKGWLNHGGLETLAAYGVHPLPSASSSDEACVAASASLAEKMPGDHRGFFDALERFVLLGDYLFAHAGIDPRRALHEQSDQDLMWIRARFLLDKTPLPYCVVHGHTPETATYRDGRRIGLDTGAYFTGRLSAARFEAEAVSFLEVR